MAHMATFLSLLCPQDVLELNFWWQMEYQGPYFGITVVRAFILHKKDLRIFQDIWDPSWNNFLRWEDARLKFSVAEVYFDFWVKLVVHYGLLCERMCSQYGAKPTSQEWVGLYRNVEDMMPKWGSLRRIPQGILFQPGGIQCDFMAPFLNPLLGCDTLPLLRCNLMWGMLYLL